MFDNFKVYNYSKSLVSPEGYGRHEANFLSGDIINGFETVIATGLQVTVKPDNAVIRSGSGGTASAHLVSLTADFTLTLATADTSNPRIDAIVLYVDTSVTLPSGTPTAANLDGLGVAKIIKVTGSPNSNPSAPNAAAIQAAIGSTSYPYTVLATWRVNANVSALSHDRCTDTRVFATPTNPRALGRNSFIENGGAASYTTSTLNGSINSGLAWISVGGVLVPQAFNGLSYTMAASKDRYFYVTLGNSTIQAATDVSNGAAAPTLPANSVWIAVVISGASAITSVKQWGEGAAGVPIYPDNGFAGWRSWTPAWTNLTLGNATVDFKYIQIGKTIQIRGKLVFGSTSSISGNVAFTAPISYNSGYNVRTVIGNLSIEDAGTASYFGYVRINDSASSNLLQFGISNVGGTYASYTAMTSSVPMTWANGDQLMISATYEAA